MSSATTRGRHGRRLLLLALLAALTFVPAGGAAGSCAGPELTLAGTDQPNPRITVGSVTTVNGRFFVDGCDDTGGQDTFGCSSDEGDVEAPLHDIELVLKQGGQRWELGSADAGTEADNTLGQVTWELTLPNAVEPGPAVLVTDQGGKLPVRIAGSS